MMSFPDRRGFIRGAAVALTAPLWSRVAFAASETDKRSVVVILRGALDGLAAVPAIGDPAYASARRELALPGAGDGAALSIGDTFALHPSFKNLKTFYDAGSLAVCQAIAIPVRERSHFEAQTILETGLGRAGGRSGWLNRVLAVMGEKDAGRAIAFSPRLPMLLRGAAPATSYTAGGLQGDAADFMSRIAVMYEHDEVLSAALGEGLRINRMAAGTLSGDDGTGDMEDRAKTGGSERNNKAPTESFAQLAHLAGTLMSDRNGPRFAVLEAFGWDTHVAQGGASGILANRLSHLDDALLALQRAMAPVWADTMITVVTEFGRTVRPNGSGGTDHGTGGAAFILGGKVAGGRVIADWPGLAERQLFENRDVRPTNDIRSLLKGGLAGHLGIDPGLLDRDVFPDSGRAAAFEGLVRA